MEIQRFTDAIENYCMDNPKVMHKHNKILEPKFMMHANVHCGKVRVIKLFNFSDCITER